MLKSNKFSLIIYLFFFTFASSCAQQKVHEITIEELISQIENNPNLVVLDVRTDSELEGSLGKLDDVIHIEISELQERIVELTEFKEKLIAVICRSGVRSSRGTKILNENGFTAKNVIGGMIAYREYQKQNIK